MLNRSGKSGHLVLFPILEEKILVFKTLGMILGYGFSCMTFMFWQFPSVCRLLSVYDHEIVSSFVKFLLYLLKWSCKFYPLLICVLHWLIFICWIILASRNKFHLVMVYSTFNVILNLLSSHSYGGISHLCSSGILAGRFLFL
jgi:hypothetical protein